MLAFLNALLEQGLALVSLGPAEPASPEALAEVLREFDRFRRPHLAGDAPELVVPASAWAAGRLYEAARFLAARDVAGAAVEEALQQPCPLPVSAGVAYSVDLLFCHLPDLHRLAVRLAPGDPLGRQLQALGAAWPLSSVGMPELNIAPRALAPVLAHPALRQLYVDRILAAADLSRLADPSVEQAAKETLGAFSGLSPEVAAHLGLPPGTAPILMEVNVR